MPENRPRILIVDDEPDNLQLMGQILRSEYELSFALDGKKGLEVAGKVFPDLIFLDVMMPVMDGYEMCQKLKTDEKTRKIPVIFVTTRDEVEDETRGFEIGAIDYISKPVKPPIVRVRVKRQLELKQAQEEVEKQNERLKILLQMREDMVNMAAHDMRTPLGAIMGYGELLAMKGAVTSNGLTYLHNIQSSAAHLNVLIDDMLVLARTEKKQLKLNRTSIDIRHLMQTVKKLHIPHAESKRIVFNVEIPEESRQVEVDVKLFQRVLDNLIGNALKFAPMESAVTLRIEYLDSTKSLVRFQIVDEGPGIPAEERERIFDKFAILDFKKKGIAQTGLGLAFCKIVIEAHGSKISVTENQPKGSIFTIEI